MGKKKKEKPKLELVYSYEPVRLLSTEDEKELKELLKPFIENSKRRKRQSKPWNGEHDPDLPPAA